MLLCSPSRGETHRGRSLGRSQLKSNKRIAIISWVGSRKSGINISFFFRVLFITFYLIGEEKDKKKSKAESSLSFWTASATRSSMMKIDLERKGKTHFLSCLDAVYLTRETWFRDGLVCCLGMASTAKKKQISKKKKWKKILFIYIISIKALLFMVLSGCMLNV
jgi:hypothetical protein